MAFLGINMGHTIKFRPKESKTLIHIYDMDRKIDVKQIKKKSSRIRRAKKHSISTHFQKRFGR